MDALPEPTDLFRPSKRRKFYRKRAGIHDDHPDSLSPQLLSPTPAPLETQSPDRNGKTSASSSNEEEGGSASVADILRQRKTAQRKRAGVEFTSGVKTTAVAPSHEIVFRENDSTPDAVTLMGSRFAPQTGRVTEETDKHMTAYIDRELAKRTQAIHALEASTTAALSPNGTPVSVPPDVRTRNPASQGKLHEIDLGPTSTLSNIARTEAAISGAPPPPPPPKKPPKARIGRNGKPYIPKPRKDRNRRNSADIARDKVVEALLHETKLDVYDDGPSEKTHVREGEQGNETEGAADERLAEQFRREYLDAMSERREKQNKMPGSGAGAKLGEDRPKGPKLGGSRSARAAMKEREEAAARAAAAAKGRR